MTQVATRRRHRWVRGLFALALGCGAGLIHAQTFPDKPITLVVPYPPGGVVDPVARLVGQKLAESVQQTVIVENKPGASGIIAAEFVKRAAPDGYTVLFASAAIVAVNPYLFAKLPYDPQRDFIPITPLISTRHVLVVPADSPANTVAELVRWGQTKPDGLSFASQGIGSGGHLLAELFKRRTGIAAEHVPYKGSAPALQDMLAGRVDFFFDAVITSLPHIKQGRLKALALATSQRLPLLPNVPTLAQLGYAGVEADHWFGVFVPAGTPAVVVTILHAEFTKAMANPEVNNKLTAQGLDVLTSSPSEFAALLQRDNTRYARLVQDAGARLD